MSLLNPIGAYGHIIGIDPDLERSGVAMWSRQGNGQLVYLKRMKFRDLVKWVVLQNNIPGGLLVRLEAGWLNEISNYHTVNIPPNLRNNPGAVARYQYKTGCRIAKNVGENHATGKLLYECLTAEGVQVQLVKPDSKKWKPERLAQLTGVATKDQELIDAASYCVGF